jgi:hypothetical protein
MEKKIVLLGGIIALSAMQPARAAIEFVFDYTYDSTGFFSDPLRRSILESAAGAIETKLSGSSLAAIPAQLNSGTEVHTWSRSFTNPGTGTQTVLNNLAIEANKMVVYAGGRTLESAAGVGGPGGFGISSSCFPPGCQVNWRSIVNTRGSSGVGPWGGSIAFDTPTTWFFDSSLATATDIPRASTDFYSVALHELGHLIGIGTGDVWNSKVVTVGGTPAFAGTKVAALNGGAPTLLNASGDHWAEGTRSTINGAGSFEAGLDPSILTGDRKELTDLDYAALEDLGWGLAPVVVIPPVIPPTVVPPTAVPPTAVPPTVVPPTVIPPTVTPPTIPPTASVPIPAGHLLLGLGLGAMLLVRRKRS